MKTPQSVPTTIDAYIAAFPDDVQAILQQIRRTIQEAAPEATEAISYQMPTFKLHGYRPLRRLQEPHRLLPDADGRCRIRGGVGRL